MAIPYIKIISSWQLQMKQWNINALNVMLTSVKCVIKITNVFNVSLAIN